MRHTLHWTALFAFALAACIWAADKELSFDDQWTPKGHLGKGDLPREKETDWVDARFRESDTGPFLTTSILVPDIDAPRVPFIDRLTPIDDRSAAPGDDRVIKALAIRLEGSNGAPKAAVLFDKQTMTLRCGWTGGFLDHSSLRFGLLESPKIGGELIFASVPDGWRRDGFDEPLAREWQGLHRHGNGIVLAYTIGGRAIRELNGVEMAGADWAFARTMEVGPGGTPLSLTLAKNGQRRAVVASVTGAVVTTREDRIVLTLPARNEPLRVKVLLGAEMLSPTAPADLAPLTKPGPRLWGEPLVTRGQTGKPATGSPFAVDTIAMPEDNPHGALLFAGGFDFAPDGACFVCTAHGDVWRVTGIDDDLEEIRWQRFATGLYQPLGLKVRDGEVFVLGRDQITRLHDRNGDGEADFYENFNDDLTDHGQPHAYAMCLETDDARNFYFLKSGAPKTPHGGTLLNLSADGKDLSVYATGFRHANGLSIGPDGTITAADPRRYAVEIWNYRWSREYGSADYLPDDPAREGRATLKVVGARVSDDGRTVFITVERLTPAMQLRVQAGLKTAAGAALPVEYYGTIHRLRPGR